MFIIAFLSACKKTKTTETKPVITSGKTVKQVIFSGAPDFASSISQENKDKSLQRFLIPINSGKKIMYEYTLVEKNNADQSLAETYVVSRVPLTNEVDLFNVPLSVTGVTAYDNSTAAKKGTMASKIILKQNEKELDLNSLVKNATISKEGEVLNLADPCEDEGTEICIDHWWVTWNTMTGEIISIEYLGSDCYQVGGCNSGGGGASQTLNCQQTATAFANQGQVKSVKYAEIDLFNNAIVWNKQYKWIIFEAGFYRLMSVEEAVLEKKPYLSNTGAILQRWEFTSFVHKNINELGISIGGSREVTNVTATPNISPTKLTAFMDLAFTIKHKIAGVAPCSIDLTYTTSCNWAAPNNYAVAQ